MADTTPPAASPPCHACALLRRSVAALEAENAALRGEPGYEAAGGRNADKKTRLHERVAELEAAVAGHETTIHAQATTIAAQAATIAEQATMISAQAATIAEHEATIAKMQKKIRKLKNDNDRLRDDVRRLRDDIAELRERERVRSQQFVLSEIISALFSRVQNDAYARMPAAERAKYHETPYEIGMMRRKDFEARGAVWAAAFDAVWHVYGFPRGSPAWHRLCAAARARSDVGGRNNAAHPSLVASEVCAAIADAPGYRDIYTAAATALGILQRGARDCM